MKSTILFALFVIGTALLVWITWHDWTHPGGKAETLIHTSSEVLSSAGAECESARKLGNACNRMSERLSSIDVFSSVDPPIAPPDFDVRGWKDSWRRWLQVREALHTIATISRYPQAVPLERVQSALRQMESLKWNYDIASDADAIYRNDLDWLCRVLEFWSAARRLDSALRSTRTAEPSATILEVLAEVEQRQALLKRFVDKHEEVGGTAERWHTSSIRAEFSKCRDKLQAVNALKDFLSRSSVNFSEQLGTVAAILRDYPEDDIRVSFRRCMRGWLEESLVEKVVTEAAGIAEIESRKMGLLRGYFQEVTDDDTVIGYRCYPTRSKMGLGETGVHRKEDLVGELGMSSPRKWVNQYNKARRRLLESPGQKELWEKFACGCEALERRLKDWKTKDWFYARQKTDWVYANRGLSFGKEGAFARRLLQDKSFNTLQMVFEP